MTYANGRLPASVLVPAANGTPVQLLAKQTARQWAAMVAYAASVGVQLQPEPDDGVPSCYRNIAGQDAAWAIYERYGQPRAATPGYSNHGLGNAVDILITPITLAFLRQYAHLFGFDNVEGAAANENWHWVCTHLITNLPKPVAKPTATIDEEIDMAQTRYYYKTEGGLEYGIMGMELPGGWRASTKQTDGEAYGILFGTDKGAPFAKLSQAKWVRAQQVAKQLNEDWVAQQKLIHAAS